MSIDSADRNLSLNFSFLCIPPPICNTMQNGRLHFVLFFFFFITLMVPAVRGASGYRKFILPRRRDSGRDVLFTRSVELKHWNFCCLQRRELWHRKDRSWCDFLVQSFGWFPLSSDPDWEIISGGFYSLEIKYSPPYEWIIHPELLTFYSNWGGGLSLTYSVATRHVTHLIIHTHLLTSWIKSQWFHLFCWFVFQIQLHAEPPPPTPNPPPLKAPSAAIPNTPARRVLLVSGFICSLIHPGAGIRKGPAGDLRTFYRWEPPHPHPHPQVRWSASFSTHFGFCIVWRGADGDLPVAYES